MGIAPYKTFTFGGESSADYGVYITGEGVFNAPERAVNMVDIPGRNGSYALDQGRFGNIEVTYNGGMVDDDVANFADRMSAFRNWLCSKKGYIRLEDDYNPDEYRMAVYKSGLEVDHEGLLTGEFDITFDCKPQRWLKSGETAIDVTSGDTITNPTLFESSPLLAVEGYGHISMNGHELDLYDRPLGDVELTKRDYDFLKYFTFDGVDTYSKNITLTNLDLLKSGDNINIPMLNIYLRTEYLGWQVAGTVDILSSANLAQVLVRDDEGSVVANVYFEEITFLYGTADTWNASLSMRAHELGGSHTLDIGVQFDVSYDGDDTTTVQIVTTKKFNVYESDYKFPPITGFSTISTLGHPSYIDCEIGEAYMYVSDEMVQLNNFTSFGSDLPTLASGTNEVTYDNTITDLKIYPRWWRV